MWTHPLLKIVPNFFLFCQNMLQTFCLSSFLKKLLFTLKTGQTNLRPWRLTTFSWIWELDTDMLIESSSAETKMLLTKPRRHRWGFIFLTFKSLKSLLETETISSWDQTTVFVCSTRVERTLEMTLNRFSSLHFLSSLHVSELLMCT